MGSIQQKTIHLVRHGEGHHNVTGDYSMHDPLLTDKGIEQAKAHCKIFPRFDNIQLVCASPLRRTIQTTLYGFADYVSDSNGKAKNKILLVPRAQEASDQPTNTASSVEEIKKQFGEERFDFTFCDKYPGMNSNDGIFAPDHEHLTMRARELRRLLREREETELVVVLHGTFLHYVTTMVTPEGEQLGGEWENCEWRVFEFEGLDDDNEAKLIEKESSWKRRDAEGPSMIAHGSNKKLEANNQRLEEKHNQK